MTALSRFLFPLPVVRRNTATLFTWWESRRPAFNLIVGAAGVSTLLSLELLARLLLPLEDFSVPWVLVLVYGVAANVCYTFGFLFELLLHRLWGDDVAPVGPTLFRHGLVFSVGVTLLPVGLACVLTVARTLWRFF